MKCGRILEMLAERGTESCRDDELSEHIDSCPECRAYADLVSELEREGAEEAQHDLSTGRIEETRAMAHEIIADRAGLRGNFPGSLSWIYSPAFMLKTAAVIVLVAALAVFIKIRTGKLPPHPNSAELAMREEIESLSHSLQGKIGTFREKYMEESRVSAMDLRRKKLKARIDLNYVRLKNDLAGVVSQSALPVAGENAGSALCSDMRGVRSFLLY